MVTGGDERCWAQHSGSSILPLPRASGAAVKALAATTAKFATPGQMIPANAEASHFPSE